MHVSYQRLQTSKPLGIFLERKSAVGEIDADRFGGDFFLDAAGKERGKFHGMAAGQLDNLFDFDPQFFGISAREALQMDPQQRIILQTTWEAIEHSNICPSDISGKRTGVYVGCASFDHFVHYLYDTAKFDIATMTGNTLSIVANRISFFFDFQGPSFAVDTACSSGLYACHLAVDAIEKGEIDTAIVGAVGVLLSPAPFSGFYKAGMLSAEGECRAFDADAKGYVRSEGAIVFVLRREETAKQNGNFVRSTILKTAINTDGVSNGLTIPCGNRQFELLETIKKQTNIDVNDIAFIEAHGTGTPVGDPIEAYAIDEAFGKGRTTPLLIGSSKTNFGHLEAASGLLGLLKTQLSLEKGYFPASLHFKKPNPYINFEELNLKVNTELYPLPLKDSPWIAGVNSFGFGGANAHLLLEGPRTPAQPFKTKTAPRFFPLTAKSENSLQKLAESWKTFLEETHSEDDVIAYTQTVAYSRPALSNRKAIFYNNKEDLIKRFTCIQKGEDHSEIQTGTAYTTQEKPVFVYSGNGAQWAGMSVNFYETNSIYKHFFDKISDEFIKRGTENLITLLYDTTLEERLGSPLIAQPLLLASQISMTEALRSEGLYPGAVVGHSAGEIAAAYTAGFLSLEQAVHVIYTRSYALEILKGSGGMAALSTTAEMAQTILEEMHNNSLVVSAINSPKSVTISGTTKALDALLIYARKQHKIAGIKLNIEIPYHSPAIDVLETQLRKDLKDLVGSTGQLPFASSTTGSMLTGNAFDAQYLWRNVRDCVVFQDAIDTLSKDGHSIFMEISPRPLMNAYINDTLNKLGRHGQYIDTEKPGHTAQSTTSIVAKAWCNGAAICSETHFGTYQGNFLDIPTYSWDNEYYRLPFNPDAQDNFGMLGHHPLLGRRIAPQGSVWHHDLSQSRPLWIADHVVDGSVVLPAAAIIDILLHAGCQILGTRAIELYQFDIVHALVPNKEGTSVRTTIEASTGAIFLHARPRFSTGEWNIIASATVRKSAKYTNIMLEKKSRYARGFSKGCLFASRKKWATIWHRFPKT